ncbi:MAG TPA: N,N-dimethylformamidase beta subunit family domain-containing protein [Nitrosopumilaceae archaeon]|nr:N,N-dimethylformamidase beta subunit family domain-containing protein [Nitrosopumilaceae archaeon]
MNFSSYGDPPDATKQVSPKVLQFVTNSKEGSGHIVTIPTDDLIFKILPKYDENGRIVSISLAKDQRFDYLYKQVGFAEKSQTTVFVYPIFTQAAYSKNGFYEYYNKKCDSTCLTINIPNDFKGTYSSSMVGSFVLSALNYAYITDIDIDKNPDILKQYKRVIILHNEYVTKKEFDAIRHHPGVVFLYPNALYAEVKTNYDKNTITLISGHGYPDASIINGFGWIPDNSKYEYNVECKDWTFYKRQNYSMLNCYPEYRLIQDPQLLRTLNSKDPTTLLDDVSNWLRYGQNSNMTRIMLGDFDITGKNIPSWVSNPAIWLINGEITRDDFNNLVDYLYQNKVIQ